ncbi:MAG: hypothetical protein JXR37_32350 [Kiritimatiellae bacterium]|nr:hypothetical protein [Kiritimatiellia bacterium]
MFSKAKHAPAAARAARRAHENMLGDLMVLPKLVKQMWTSRSRQMHGTAGRIWRDRYASMRLKPQRNVPTALAAAFDAGAATSPSLIGTQRAMYRRGRLRPTRARLLGQLGFAWRVSRTRD